MIDPRREICPLLATLFETPDESLPVRVNEAYRRLARVLPGAAEHLHLFARELAGRSPAELQECHAATFEINPVCIPYLSVHAFGDESFKRAELMTGLAEVYRAAGWDWGRELPDHLAIVLHFVPRFRPAEWNDLLRFCLTPAVEKMARALETGTNPYRHLLNALRATLHAAPVEEALAHV